MAFSFFMKRQKKEGAKKPSPETKQRVSPPQVAANHDNGNNGIDSAKSFYAFIDASNLFWGGKESMGFGVDYRKLKRYIETKFGVTKIFFYNGVRIFDFEYSILDNKPLDLAKLTEHLKNLKTSADEKENFLIDKTLSRINFYQRLEEFGYILKIKPAKVSFDEDDENRERPILKANCDVDMTFDMMRYMQQYSGVVAMTGDGDFAAVLNYLKAHDRKVVVLSRWERTAKEIKQIAGDSFVDFSRLRNIIKYR